MSDDTQDAYTTLSGLALNVLYVVAEDDEWRRGSLALNGFEINTHRADSLAAIRPRYDVGVTVGLQWDAILIDWDLPDGRGRASIRHLLDETIPLPIISNL